MKKIFCSLITFVITLTAVSQSVVPIRGDTIRVYKQGDTATLKVDSLAAITKQASIGKDYSPWKSSVSLNLTDTIRAIRLNKMYSRNNIATPENGMMIYEDSTSSFVCYFSGAWGSCGGINTRDRFGKTGEDVSDTEDRTFNSSETGDFAFLVRNFDAFANNANGYAQLFALRPQDVTSQINLTNNNNTTSEAGFTSIFSSVTDTAAEFTIFATRVTPTFTKGGANYGSYIRLENRNVILSPHPTGGNLKIKNLPTTIDTTWKLLVLNPTGDSTTKYFTSWGQMKAAIGRDRFGVSGEDATATQNRIFAGAGFSFLVTGTNAAAISSTSAGVSTNTFSTGGTSLQMMHDDISGANSDASIFADDANINLNKSITGKASLITLTNDSLYLRHSTSGKISEILVKSDSIYFKPHLGQFNIDSLREATGTKTVRYDPATGIVSYHDIPTGGGSNLSWDAANHQVDIDGGGTSATIPYATPSADGLVSTALQTFGGDKIFNDKVGIGVTPTYILDVLDDATGQTGSNRLAQFSNAGSSYDASAGNLTSYLGYFSNTATRSAGANNLTNIALYGHASGAQSNFGLYINAGKSFMETGTTNFVNINGDPSNATIFYITDGTSAKIINANGNGTFSIGTAGQLLGTLQLSGNTSGTVSIRPAAAAGTYTIYHLSALSSPSSANIPITASPSSKPIARIASVEALIA